MKVLLLAFMLMFVAAPCFASPCDDTQGAASKARLEELIKKYPNSPEAARAKTFLKTNK